MPAVTELEVFTAWRAKMIAAGGWFADPAMKFHFGRRPPNAGLPPYTVIAVEEDDEAAETESDGATLQRFRVEAAVRAIGPDDAEAANAALVGLDAKWTTAADIAISGDRRGVVSVFPKGSRLRMIEPLVAGEDQYTAARRWEVLTSAFIGSV